MVSNRLSLLLLASLAVAFAATPAAAQDTDEPIAKLRLSGFGTIGVAHSNISHAPGSLPWGFRRDASQPLNDGGTRFDTDSLLGLQANYTVDSRFELVGQLQLERRVASAKPLDSLALAFAAWHPLPDLTIRVGRTSPDIFLLSEYRSVGFAYPWVRPNTDTYALLPIFSVDGADVAKVWDIGDVRWRAKLFVGQGHTRAPNAPGDPDLDFRLTQLVGGMVSRESGGLLLRATLGRFRGGLGAQPWQPGLRQALAQVQQLPIPQVAAEASALSDAIDPDRAVLTYFALGAAYEHDDWLLSGEVVRLSSKFSYASADTGYLSLGRRFGAMTFFGTAGAARSIRQVPATPQWAAVLTPVVGAAAAQQIQALGAGAAQATGERVDQRSFSLGMRWDLQPQVAVKVQWDRVQVRPHGSLLWGSPGADAAQANVASVTVDFVF
jgi:hypothetical protein